MKFLFAIIFCLGIGYLIRCFLNKTTNETTPKKKDFEIKLNKEFLERNKTEVEKLKLPKYIHTIYKGNVDQELPFGDWNKPVTFSYMTNEELSHYNLHYRIVPIIEDYAVYAFDKKRESFLEFHVEDTKHYDEYPIQNWQQFLTNIVYKWYNLHMIDEDQSKLPKIKKAAELLEYEHFDSLIKLLDNNIEADLNTLENEIEKLKTKMS